MEWIKKTLIAKKQACSFTNLGRRGLLSFTERLVWIIDFISAIFLAKTCYVRKSWISMENKSWTWFQILNSTINRSKHSKYITIKCNKIEINKITITFSPFNRFMLFKDTLHVSTITLISQSKSPHEIPASEFRHEARNLLNIVVISLIYLSLQYFTKCLFCQ